MKPSIRMIGAIGLLALAVLQAGWIVSTTAKHNAQLKAQAETFNGQLTAMTETHNAQLLAQVAEFQKKLAEQAAQYQKK